MRYFQDPTVPDRETRKRVYFWEDKQKHINFAARVQLDGLKQGQFFRAILDGYMNQDPHICAYLDEYKERWTVQGQRKREAVKRMKKRAAEQKKMFSLNENEVETIFDILEGETGL